MSPQAKALKEYELARLEYLVEDGYGRFKRKLEKARKRSDAKWEKRAQQKNDGLQQTI